MATQDIRAEGKHQIVVRMPVGLHSRLVESLDRDESVNGKVCELVEREMDRIDRARVKAAA